MVVDGVRLIGGGQFDYSTKKVEEVGATNEIFNFNVQPEAFGGKNYGNLETTSIFDSYDC